MMLEEVHVKLCRITKLDLGPGYVFVWLRYMATFISFMGVAGLIRRPLVAVWFYLSGHLIERVGDLKTIAVSLFLFSVSFLAISFINIPWLVLVVDILQAAGYAFSYTGLNIHFSKSESKASSAVILGKKSCRFKKINNTLTEIEKVVVLPIYACKSRSSVSSRGPSSEKVHKPFIFRFVFQNRLRSTQRL